VTKVDYSSVNPDKKFMRLALREAWKGLGITFPNPMVGAVIVANGKVASRGYHAVAGGPHAEIAALNNLASPDQARGATLYVTLEPCSTHGRTPPCTEAILKAGFARVVYGTTDPSPEHQGKAKKIFQEAGIAVTNGILDDKCAALNHAWNHRIKTGMPWIIAKCGMSLDGRIHSPYRNSITSEASRHHAMLFRRHVDAILVGGNTVRCDNPQLTIRDLRENKNQPWRVIWTRSEKNIPKKAHLLTDEYRDKTILIQDLSLREGLQNLAERGISSVLIEGGGITLGKAFEDGLVDEIRFYIAPIILGGSPLAISSESLMIPAVKCLKLKYRSFRDEIIVTGLLSK